MTRTRASARDARQHQRPRNAAAADPLPRRPAKHRASARSAQRIRRNPDPPAPAPIPAPEPPRSSAVAAWFGGRSRRAITREQCDAFAQLDPEFAKALLRHRRFHGCYPDSLELVDVPGDPDVRYLVSLGDSVAIEYDPHRTSKRAGIPFRHEFKRGRQNVVTDPDGRGVYITKRVGSRLRVTERGIED